MTDLREAMRAAATSSDLVPVDVPEWGRKVFIRRLAVRDQVAIEKMSGDDPKMTGLRTLVLSLCDEDGSQLLGDDDLDLLMDQSLAVVIPLLMEAARHNGLSSKEVEEAVAAFGKAPGLASSTD